MMAPTSRLLKTLLRSSRLTLFLSLASLSTCLLILFTQLTYPADFEPDTTRPESETYSGSYPVSPPDWAASLPPNNPSAESYSQGAEWFPSLQYSQPSRPPKANPFSRDELEKLYPQRSPFYARPPTEPWAKPLSTFARDWVPPQLAPKKVLPKVQLDPSSFANETLEERETREDRKQIVRNAFIWAWEGYKQHAWGHDEVRPLTKRPSDPFSGWGATIIDSLDTLLLLGLPEEYSLAREHVRQLNFEIISGKNWKKGIRFSRNRNYEPGVSPYPALAVFETTIRYLGGLLSAFDLTGDQLMLDRAEELAQILIPAFDTPTGIPLATIEPGRPKAFGSPAETCLAEAGSMTLEFTRLWQLTGNITYFHYVQRVTDYIDQELVKRSVLSPLLPTTFDADSDEPIDGMFTFGGQADSYYEYLIKEHQLLGGRLPQYARMYAQVMDQANKVLIKEVTSVPGRSLLTIGEVDRGVFKSTLEHLTCFAGAMIGLGSKLLNRHHDLETAKQVTQTCYYTGAMTATGLQPEKLEFYDSNSPGKLINVLDEQGKFLWKKPAGRPMGVKKVNGKYINRPETIESVFYMYRLTGDKMWQEKGWRMFSSWMKTSLAPAGFSSVAEVRSDHPSLVDNMESFALAETLKYHYLLHADPSELSLDDYVLNTEAHPFIVNERIQPGSQGLWNPSVPPSSPLTAEDREVPLGEGSHVQKWAIFKQLP